MRPAPNATARLPVGDHAADSRRCNQDALRHERGHLRAQPAWFIDPKIDKKLVIPLAPLDKDGTPIRDAAPDEKIEIQCVRTPRGENTAPTESTDVSQCLYESIDMRDVLRVPIRNSAERNRMVHLLMNVSNDNCSTFLMRAFAQKAGNEATRNTLKDFATAVASGTARVAAVASANLGIASLFTTTAVDNVNNRIGARQGPHHSLQPCHADGHTGGVSVLRSARRLARVRRQLLAAPWFGESRRGRKQSKNGQRDSTGQGADA